MLVIPMSSPILPTKIDNFSLLIENRTFGEYAKALKALQLRIQAVFASQRPFNFDISVYAFFCYTQS